MKTNNVLAKMQEITEHTVKCYKTDFYDYDAPRIKKERPSELVWMVRDSGTHMMTPEDCFGDGELWRYYYDIFAAMNDDFYYVTLNSDGSGTVTKSVKKCAEFADRMSSR